MSNTAHSPGAAAVEPEILARVEGRAGRITLNRPRQLHALSLGMCLGIVEALLKWRDDQQVQLVIIDHSGERGFCAGGDIRAVSQSGAGDKQLVYEFFLAEYRMNELMFRYPKPIIPFMDGVTMGGGVGISMPGRYRVATERTLWAMPEGDIGFFPDVGEGWYLPRLPGYVGTWLGLTGARLKAADLMELGIATHCVQSARIPAYKEQLIHSTMPVDQVLLSCKTLPGEAPVNAQRARIDRIYSLPSMERIMEALAADSSPEARAEREQLLKKCPMSLKVTLRLLRGPPRRFVDNMIEEYRIAVHMASRADFREGVRAVLIDKDNAPRWKPPTLAEVTDDMVEDVFADLPGHEWTPVA